LLVLVTFNLLTSFLSKFYSTGCAKKSNVICITRPNDTEIKTAVSEKLAATKESLKRAINISIDADLSEIHAIIKDALPEAYEVVELARKDKDALFLFAGALSTEKQHSLDQRLKLLVPS
jgi:hypothetical protein